MENKPQAPVININGSSKSSLLDQYILTIGALRTAMEAHRMIAPHGRDFQTTAEGTYHKARKEFEIRHLKLKDVLEDLENIANQIADQ